MGDRERLVRDGAPQRSAASPRRREAGGAGPGEASASKKRATASRYREAGSHLHLDVTCAACTGPNHSHRTKVRSGRPGRWPAGRPAGQGRRRDAMRRDRGAFGFSITTITHNS